MSIPQYKLLLVFCGLLGISIIGCDKEQVSDAEKTGSIQISTSVDTNSATIGDQIHLRLSVSNTGNYLVDIPDFPADSSLEPIVRSIQSEKNEISVNYTLAVWDTGNVVLPKLPVRFLNPDSTLAFSMLSDSLILRIQSVTRQNGAQTELRPIKAPVPVRRPFPWKSTVLIVALVLLLIAVWFIGQQRRSKQIEFDAPDALTLNIPPDELALQRLEKAREWMERDIKEFYTHLSYLTREYVEHAFYIKTLEMTTADILRHNSLFPFSDALFEAWGKLLSVADMIKYARHTPSEKNQEHDWQWTEKFIRETVPLWKISLVETDNKPEAQQEPT